MWIFLVSFVLLTFIGAEDRGLNWYESLPAVAMDYKVLLEASEWIWRENSDSWE